MSRIFRFSLFSLLVMISGVTKSSNLKNIYFDNKLELKIDNEFLKYNSLIEKINEAWEISWERFYHPKTNQFYDYLISYEKGEELSHLPSAEEVSRLYPNDCGYGTGMEDCMISAGVMLAMIIDQYDVTGNENLKKYAQDVFSGIKLSATTHNVHGFLARGVCVDDGKSTYICSSRDQYTHAVHGLWRYYHSSLSSFETKIQIGEILSAFADRMESFIKPENDFSFMRANGTPDVRKISKMWNVKGHEAARLPMIYAAAWDVTGNRKYFDLYRHYIESAVEQSYNIEDVTPTYSFLQMQCSFELLLALEKDVKLKDKMKEIMIMTSNRALKRAISANIKASQLDFTMLTTDWRNGKGIESGEEYRKVWYCVRESGEAALTQLMSAYKPFTEDQKSLLLEAITRLDYKKVSTSGIFYLQGAYWKARKHQIINEKE